MRLRVSLTKFAISSSLNSEGLTLRWNHSVLAELCHLGCVCGLEDSNGRSRPASLHAECILQMTQCAAATGSVPCGNGRMAGR